jgi:magnesium-transporting ATPase (P-type)
MLTGDKGITAKEIAYSCGLLYKDEHEAILEDSKEVQFTDREMVDHDSV